MKTVTTQSKSDAEIGQYHAPQVLLKFMGKGRNGINALKNYIYMTCMIGGRYFAWSSWRKQVDILWVEAGVQDRVGDGLEYDRDSVAVGTRGGSEQVGSAGGNVGGYTRCGGRTACGNCWRRNRYGAGKEIKANLQWG